MAANYMTYGDAETIMSEYSADIKNGRAVIIETIPDSSTAFNTAVKKSTATKDGSKPPVIFAQGIKKFSVTHGNVAITNPTMRYAVVNVGNICVGYSETDGVVTFKCAADNSGNFYMDDFKTIATSGGESGTSQIAVAECKSEIDYAEEFKALQKAITDNAAEFGSYRSDGDILDGYMYSNNMLMFKNGTVLSSSDSSFNIIYPPISNLFNIYHTESIVTKPSAFSGLSDGFLIGELFEFAIDDFINNSYSIGPGYNTTIDVMSNTNDSYMNADQKLNIPMAEDRYRLYGRYSRSKDVRTITLELSGLTIFGGMMHIYIIRRTNGNEWMISQRNYLTKPMTGYAGMQEVIDYGFTDTGMFESSYSPIFTEVTFMVQVYEDDEGTGFCTINSGGAKIPCGDYIIKATYQDYQDMTWYFEFINVGGQGDHKCTFVGYCKNTLTSFNSMTLTLLRSIYNNLNFSPSYFTLTYRSDSTVKNKWDSTGTEVDVRIVPSPTLKVLFHLMVLADRPITTVSKVSDQYEFYLNFAYTCSGVLCGIFNNFINYGFDDVLVTFVDTDSNVYPNVVVSCLISNSAFEFIFYNHSGKAIPANATAYLPSYIEFYKK